MDDSTLKRQKLAAALAAKGLSSEDIEDVIRNVESSSMMGMSPTVSLQIIASEAFDRCKSIPSVSEPVELDVIQITKGKHWKRGTERIPATYGAPGRPHMLLYSLGKRGFVKGMELENFPTLKDAANNCTVLLGPSGCGKTRKIYEFLHSHYGYFIPYKAANDKTDGSSALHSVVTELMRDTRADWREANPSHDVFQQRRDLAEFAITCVLVAYAVVFNRCARTSQKAQHPSRWLLLQLFPVRFFGVDIFERIAVKLFREGLVHEVRQFHAYPNRFHCFLDETQELDRLLPDSFLTTQIGDRQPSRRRPLLSAVLSGIKRAIMAYPTLSGTSLNLLSEWSSSVSSVAIEDHRFVFVDFPLLNESEVATLLKTLLKNSRDDVDYAAKWLVGRPRLVTEFIADVMEKDVNIRDYLPQYISRLTEKESHRSEPLTFADSFGNLITLPSSARAALPSANRTLGNAGDVLANSAARMELKGEDAENQLYAALTDAFLLSIGSSVIPRQSSALLEWGLGFPDVDHKTSIKIRYEPLLIEAALLRIFSNFDSFVEEFLRSVSDDPSHLGKRFAIIAALKLADFFTSGKFKQALEGLGPSQHTLPEMPWDGLKREFGRLATTVTTSPDFYAAFRKQEFSLLFPDAKVGPDAVFRLDQKGTAMPLVIMQCKLKGKSFNVEQALHTIDPRKFHHSNRGTGEEKIIKGIAKEHAKLINRLAATSVIRVLVAPLQTLQLPEISLIDNHRGGRDVLIIVDERNSSSVLGSGFLRWLRILKDKLPEKEAAEDADSEEEKEVTG